LKILIGHTSAVCSVIELSDRSIASGSPDNTIRIWDSNLRTCLKILTDHTNTVYYVIELSDGRIASDSANKSIQIWDSNLGALLRTFDAQTSGFDLQAM
jgi:WD40 repeat protein